MHVAALGSLLAGPAAAAVSAPFAARPPRDAWDVSWRLLGGLAGGLLVTSALSSEYLASGTGGVLAAGLGGLGGAAAVGAAARHATPGAAEVARDAPPASGAASRRRALLVVVGLVLVASLAAAAHLLVLSLLLVLLPAAVGFVRCGATPAAGLFLGAAVGSGGLVVLGETVLSPLRLVGAPVATTLAMALVLSPLLLLAAQRCAWTAAAAAVGLSDVLALLVAVVAGLTWWSLFDGLSAPDVVSQAVRLGEDNVVHLLLLTATERTGAAPGTAATGALVTSDFNAYFPGAAVWQASVRDALPAAPTAVAYVQTTAVSVGLLLGLVASAVGSTVRRVRPLAAVAVVGVSALGLRFVLAAFELGFPGQLLSAVFVAAALLLGLSLPGTRRGQLLQSGLLFVFALACWRSWSLAAPPVLAAAVAPAFPALWRVARARPRAAASGVAVVVVVGLLVLPRAVAVLDVLLVEGAVFRAVPLWPAFALPLLLLASGARRTRTGAVPTLVLASAGLALVLCAWQVARTGAVTYYGYKAQYLLLVAGLVAAVRFAGARAAEPRLRSAAGVAACLALVAVAVPTAPWPAESYRSWLTARGVLGPDPHLRCALAAYREAGTDQPAVALGADTPLVDYVVTKTVVLTTATDASRPLWRPVLDQPDPSTWPWQESPRRITLLLDASPASAARASALQAAAGAAGVAVTTVPTDCPG